MDSYKNLYLLSKKRYNEIRVGGDTYSPITRDVLIKNARKALEELENFEKALSGRRPAIADEEELEELILENKMKERMERINSKPFNSAHNGNRPRTSSRL